MISRPIGRAWLRFFGWKTQGSIDHPKFVLIAAPHTSNWDFPFMVAVSWTLGMEVHWLGKHTLFKGLAGRFFRALGGIPVDRRSRHNLVDQVAEQITEAERIIVAVPPEGTRGKVDFWKSGFYHIAVRAGVPIALGFLDFERRVGGVGGYIWPSGDVQKDMDKIRAFYADIRGKHPELECTPRLRDEG